MVLGFPPRLPDSIAHMLNHHHSRARGQPLWRPSSSLPHQAPTPDPTAPLEKALPPLPGNKQAGAVGLR